MAEEVPDTQPSESWEVEHKCLKCESLTSLSQGAVQKANGLYCKLCSNVYQMLYRHLGGMPPTLQSMSAKDQAAFFKRAQTDLVQAVSKNARWSMVRSALLSEMVRYTKEQTIHRVSQEYLPLSVWEQRGFDTKKIKEKGKKMDHEAGPNFVLNPYMFFKV